MISWTGLSRTPIGVDLGRQLLKAVQLSGSWGRWNAIAVYCQQRPDPTKSVKVSELTEFCDELANQGFVGKQMVLAVPHEQQLTANLELPPRDTQAPLEQIAHHELARLHQIQPENMESACWDLPSPARAGSVSHMMAVGCRHAQADALLDAVENRGWTVTGLDIHAWALTRACSVALTQRTEIGLILDVGWSAARLIVIHQNVVIYQRLLADSGVEPLIEKLTERLDHDPVSAGNLIKKIGLGQEKKDLIAKDRTNETASAQRLARDHFDAMAEELRLSFVYVAHRYPDVAANRLLLTGGGGAIPGLAGFLKQVLNVDVAPIEAAGLGLVADLPSSWQACVLADALGLATY